MGLLTQRSGTEEDPPGRLPPSSSSSVIDFLRFLHGSQLLTSLIVIHQPNKSTQVHKINKKSCEILKAWGINVLFFRCCFWVHMCLNATCQTRASGHPHGTPCLQHSSRRMSPLLTPPLFGWLADDCHTSLSYRQTSKRPNKQKTQNEHKDARHTEKQEDRQVHVNTLKIICNKTERRNPWMLSYCM